MTTPEIAREFTSYAETKLADSLAQIERCVRLLGVDQIWHRPNSVSNAIGNLVVHLAGNVRQWILGGVAGEPVDRDRPAEFALREALPPDEILDRLKSTVAAAREVIARQREPDLVRRVRIQGYEVSVLAAIFHVVEHFSLHTGQIVYATKLLIDRDLSLYDSQGRRIDGRDEGTP